MDKRINVKKIIKKNKLIELGSFEIEQKLLDFRREFIKENKYNILPPFSTERRIKASMDIEKKEVCG